ncbi:hypothetical protein [Falsibacillus pallidus]|uniref:hypothetical protein n=1 Tax=Falsibacillus pallidus TaxID=493781 RepID=UPI003D96873B
MNNMFKTVISILIMMVLWNESSVVEGKDRISTEQPISVEKAYELMGYTDFDNALKQYNKKGLILPSDVPFKVEYQYAKVDSESSSINFEYLGENFSRNHLSIKVSPKSNPDYKNNLLMISGEKAWMIEATRPEFPTIISFKKNDGYYTVMLHMGIKPLERAALIQIAEELIHENG